MHASFPSTNNNHIFRSEAHVASYAGYGHCNAWRSFEVCDCLSDINHNWNVKTVLFNRHKASRFICGIPSEVVELFMRADRRNDELI
jgi:hypothetical protein